MIAHIKNSKESATKLLELISEFSNHSMQGQLIKISCIFMYQQQTLGHEIYKTHQYDIIRNMKYLGINLMPN